MIELMLGIIAICAMISLTSLVVKAGEFLFCKQSENIVKREGAHREKVRARRAERYSSRPRKTDWRDFAA